MKKRLFAIALALCLCLTLLPAAALATEWRYSNAQSVSTAAELVAALPSGENEPDEHDIVWIPQAELAADVTVDPEHSVHTLGKLVVPAGRTLTIEAGAELEAEVENHGTVNVQPGGALMTTMAGENAIANYGTINVARGATLASQKGGNVRNKAGGMLEMDGLFTCNGYDAPWFDNAGTVSGHGQVVVPKLFHADSVDKRIAAANIISDYCVGSDVEVFVSAYDLGEMQTLAGNGSVRGVFVTTEQTDTVEVHVTGALDLTGKKLMLDAKVNLILDAGATLTVGALSDLYYNGRWCKLAVPALGGTLRIGGTAVISGDASAGAIFTVTAGEMFTSGGEWAWMHPVTENLDKWYYVQSGGAVSAAGAVTNALNLTLIVDGALNITDSFSIPYAEIRDEINDPDDKAQIDTINYCPESAERAVRGQSATNFELDFDLNTGSGYADIYDHLAINAGKTYLRADGNDVPVTPTRSGYTFTGWKATSKWSATAEQLAAFTVKRADGDTSETGWYVDWPTQFPVRMVAQWSADSYDGGGSASARTETPAETKAEVADDGSVTATVSAADAEKGSATLPVTVEAAADTASAPTVTVDLPADAELTVEIPVANATAGTVAVLVHADGTEEILPDTALTEKGVAVELKGGATLKIVDNTQSFGDVTAEHWGEEAVAFVSARGLMQGVGGGAFDPDGTMDRAMIATVLYRLERKPDVETKADFADVEDGTWYSAAITWASETGIVEGYGESFGTGDPVTREQLAVMLWRLSGRPAAAAVEAGASDWAAQAMSWAISAGLIQGDENGYRAGDTASRAEAAAILMRYIDL